MIARRTLVVGAAAALIARAAMAAERDLTGWGKARWGMTHDELTRTLGDAVKPTPAALSYKDLDAADMIERVELGGRFFLVLFQYALDTKRLRQVLLNFRGGTPQVADFAAVERALTDELGAAERASNGTDYSGSFPSYAIERDWRFPSTIVHLRYTDPNAESARARKELQVRYSAR